MQARLATISGLLLATLMLFGCGREFHLEMAELSQKSPWPFHHGDLEGQSAVKDGSFNGKLDVVWEQGTDRPAGPLTIYNGLLYDPGADDRIRIYDMSDGRYRGRLKSLGTPQTGLVLQDTLAFFSTAPIKNQLYAYDLRRNRRIWRRPLRDAVNGTILYRGSLIVASRPGMVLALDPVTGETRWDHPTEALITTPPVAFENRVFVATDDAHLLALSADSGQELYSVELEETTVSPPAVQTLVYVGDVDGNVYGIDPFEGSVQWTVQVAGSIWASPAVAGGMVFIGDRSGQITALNGATGETIWRHQVTEVISSSPVVVNGYLVVGTLAGKVISLRAADGQVIEERQFRGGIACGPVSDGQRVYIATERGDLIALGEDNATNYSEAGQ